MNTRALYKKLNIPLLKPPTYNLLATLSILLLLKIINDCFNDETHESSKSITAASTNFAND